LPPFENPELHIPFNSNLLVSASPYRRRDHLHITDDQKLVKVIYKINFENMNQLFETYSRNKYQVKRRKILLRRNLALHWTILSGAVALDCFLWYTLGLNKTTLMEFEACLWGGITVFCFVLVYGQFLVTNTCVKPPNNASDNLED
jgi:hypothetical protein